MTDCVIEPIRPEDPDYQAAIKNAITSTSASKAMHQGMPPFEDDGPALSFYEFWPTKLFYIPITIWWIWLSIRYGGATLPTIANPHFPLGGLVGESKEDVLKVVEPHGREALATYCAFDKAEQFDSSKAQDLSNLCALARDKMAEVNIDFPAVAKPDMGCRGVGVQLVRDQAALEQYLKVFPAGGRVMIQALVPYEPEAGVFYIRHPLEEKGHIFSITLKYNPYVIGDGHSTLRELIKTDERAGQISHVYMERHKSNLDTILPEGQKFRLAFAGSHSRGTIFRNGNSHITEEMRDAFDRLAKAIPEFYFGRFDCRFPDIEDLKAGRKFKIVEINGAGGEATHIWDRKTPILKAYGTLFKQYEWLFRIGAANKKREFKPSSLWQLWKFYRHEKKLTAEYPFTE